MATKFSPAPAPDLAVREHVFVREWDGRVLRCGRCNLPKRNRVHVEPGELLRAQWREMDAARLGERDL